MGWLRKEKKQAPSPRKDHSGGLLSVAVLVRKPLGLPFPPRARLELLRSLGKRPGPRLLLTYLRQLQGKSKAEQPPPGLGPLSQQRMRAGRGGAFALAHGSPAEDGDSGSARGSCGGYATGWSLPVKPHRAQGPITGRPRLSLGICPTEETLQGGHAAASFDGRRAPPGTLEERLLGSRA